MPVYVRHIHSVVLNKWESWTANIMETRRYPAEWPSCTRTTVTCDVAPPPLKSPDKEIDGTASTHLRPGRDA